MFHVHTLADLPRLGRSAVTIGNFDGVHRGHRALLERLVTRARAEVLDAVAVTFEPHPVRYFRGPGAPCFRLTSARQRARYLAGLGLDGLVVLAFDAALAAMTPDAFVEQIIAHGLAPAFVLVGYDFNFGKGRAGSPDDLRRAGPRFGFEVETYGPFEVDGAPVSSSRVRSALRDGRVDVAERLLGRPYALEGQIVSGDGRGRQLGFPTANLRTSEQLVPDRGIYATTLVDGGHWLPAVTSIGIRPTFYQHDADVVVETFVLDAAPALDLYGHDVELVFHGRLRSEARFDSVELLVEQMHRDVEQARQLHASAGAGWHGGS